MDGPRQHVASLAALGGAIGAVGVDALYVNLIFQQGAMMPGTRVPFVVGWIAIAALLAGVGAFVASPLWRAWLLGLSGAGLLALSVPAVFSAGIPLFLCAIPIWLGARRAAEQLKAPSWVLLPATIGLLALAGCAIILGFSLTA